MKSKILGTLAVLSVACLFLGASPKEAKCPISGKPASPDHVLNVNGKEVAFCCGNCPKAYAAKINLKGGAAALAAAPGKCPISGKPATKEQQVIRKTAKLVSFCCGNCLKKCVTQNKLTLKDEGPKKCPVSGKPATAEQSLLVNGEKVYFCCGNCRKGYAKQTGLDVAALEKDPGKCPISGKPATKDQSLILVKSELVSFCCGNCKKKYIAANFEDGRVIEKKDAKKDKAKAEKEKVRL